VWICAIFLLSFVEGIPHSVFMPQDLSGWEIVLKGIVRSAITSSFILCKKYALAYRCMSSYDLDTYHNITTLAKSKISSAIHRPLQDANDE
jgi:hypothetical protein